MLPPYKSDCKTITFDNCGDLSGHASIAQSLGRNIYFAKPCLSWHREFNENTNGLLRRFFPEGMKIDDV